MSAEAITPVYCAASRTHRPALTDNDLQAWRDAAVFLLGHGYTPLLPNTVLRALWRRGGTDRRLAELLHPGCGGEAA